MFNNKSVVEAKKSRIMGFKKFVTHGGKFHADDVMSMAWMILLQDVLSGYRSMFDIPKPRLRTMDNLERVFTVPEEYLADPSICIFDIGGGEFDHHQGLEYRCINYDDTPMHPYASFGKLFREFAECILPLPVITSLDRDFVSPIDSADNGITGNNISSYIACLNPAWDESSAPEDMLRAFKGAVVVAVTMLHNTIKSALKKHIALEICIDADLIFVEHPTHHVELMILDRYVPWISYAVENGIHAAIYPNLRGGWACSVASDENGNVCKFPQEWRDGNLPEGIDFCHISGFMIASQDKDILIEACKSLTDFT